MLAANCELGVSGGCIWTCVVHEAKLGRVTGRFKDPTPEPTGAGKGKRNAREIGG